MNKRKSNLIHWTKSWYFTKNGSSFFILRGLIYIYEPSIDAGAGGSPRNDEFAPTTHCAEQEGGYMNWCRATLAVEEFRKQVAQQPSGRCRSSSAPWRCSCTKPGSRRAYEPSWQGQDPIPHRQRDRCEYYDWGWKEPLYSKSRPYWKTKVCSLIGEKKTN